MLVCIERGLAKSLFPKKLVLFIQPYQSWTITCQLMYKQALQSRMTDSQKRKKKTGVESHSQLYTTHCSCGQKKAVDERCGHVCVLSEEYHHVKVNKGKLVFLVIDMVQCPLASPGSVFPKHYIIQTLHSEDLIIWGMSVSKI